ncbi:atromentin synthetase [Suillus ampliporus]|nr:atromentin synthetase [Suillus ampliporus]
MAQANTLLDAIFQAVNRYPSHELSFITSAHDSSIRTKTFSAFNQYVRNLARAMLEWGKPTGSIIIVYLTEHEDNMAVVWACLAAGYVPCVHPPLSAQQAHKDGHISHINKLLGSAPWLTSELGAEQISTVSGLEVLLFSELKASVERFSVPADWVAYEAKPDDKAIICLTSGSTGFSKAVVHTHRTILGACRAKQQSFGTSPEFRVLNWVGFDHIGGLVEMHIQPLLCGASQLHVNASALLYDSVRLLRLIDEKECQHPTSIGLTFAPNFLLAKLARDLEKRTDLYGTFDLSSIKQITSGGESVVSKTAKAFVATMKRLSKNPSAVTFVISVGFGMTELVAGCTHSPIDVLATEPAREFLDLGRPIESCEMRIVDPADGTTLRPDGESGELQVRGPMVFAGYYNNPEATSSSFVDGGWFRTGDVCIAEKGILRLISRIKDTVIIRGISYGLPELETHLQTVEGVTHSFLAASPYRGPGEETEGIVIFYSPTFDLDGADAAAKLFATHRALRDVSVKMITQPPHFIIPIPVNQMEKTTLGKLSRSRLLALFQQGGLAKHITRAEELLSQAHGASLVPPSTDMEKAIAKIYGGIFNLVDLEVSASANFFELGGTSIHVIRLKRELEAHCGMIEIPTVQILRHPVLSTMAKYVSSLLSNDSQVEEYDPIVPLQLTGSKTPIFFVHPGVGDILVFVTLASFFQNERPFYALRARGFEPGQPFFTTMDEMVTCYTAAVKKTQPTGPYAVAGYSYGGALAFEIARRLEDMGDEVKFVGIINVPPYLYHMREIEHVVTLSYYIGLLTKQEVDDIGPVLRPLPRKEQLQVVWNMSSPERLVELHMTHEKLEHWLDMAASLIRCGQAFRPSGSLVCPAVNIFYAVPPQGGSKNASDWLENEIKQWSRFTREPTYIEVPGDNRTLMDGDHAPQLQKLLRGRLEASGM